MSKVNTLIFGEKLANHITNLSVLILGAGGIGTELIKILTSSGITKITIIDYDEIEKSNLSRQFYFTEENIGKPKVSALQQKLRRLRPNVEIVAIQGSVMDKKYANPDFFEKFDLIYNAVDDVEARKVVVQTSIRANRPLIDAGTGGKEGWTHPVLRNYRPCKYCNHVPEVKAMVPTCTLRANPTKTEHCVLWAKNLWECLYAPKSNSRGNDWGEEFRSLYFNLERGIEIEKMLMEKYDEFFYKAPHELKQLNDLNNKSNITPISYETSLQIPRRFAIDEVTGETTSEDELLTIKEYAELFISSALLLRAEWLHRNQDLMYSVDNPNIIDFIYAASNLRVYNFNASPTKSCSLVPITRSEIKKLTKDIQAIVGSTNSIIGALQTEQGLKVVTERRHDVSTMQLRPEHQRLTPDGEHCRVIAKENAALGLDEDLNLCKHCGIENYFKQIRANFSEMTWGELGKFIKNAYLLPNGRLLRKDDSIVYCDAPGPEYIELDDADLIDSNEKLPKERSLVLRFFSNCSKAVKSQNVSFLVMNENGSVAATSGTPKRLQDCAAEAEYLSKQHSLRALYQAERKIAILSGFKFFD